MSPLTPSKRVAQPSEVYRLMSELICVFVNARPNSYGPIPEDAICLGVLAALANLQYGNRRLDQWHDIRNLADDAIGMLSNETEPLGTIGEESCNPAKHPIHQGSGLAVPTKRPPTLREVAETVIASSVMQIPADQILFLKAFLALSPEQVTEEIVSRAEHILNPYLTT